MTRPPRRLPPPAPPLPRAARRRLERPDDGVRSSLLGASAALGLDAVGLRPIGDVMGCVGMALNPELAGICHYAYGRPSRVRLGKDRDAWGGGYSSYLTAVRAGYTRALTRLEDEAAALGAHGVVGVQVRTTHVGAEHDDVEILALGTAVRFGDRPAVGRPFSTDLPGTDVAKLLLGGWVPVRLHVAVEVGIRHLDGPLPGQAGTRQTNFEQPDYTELMQVVRAAIRTRLRRQIAQCGADGGLLGSMQSRHWHRRCMYNNGDGVLELVALGTAVARFRQSPQPPSSGSLTILPLTRATTTGSAP